MKDRQGSGFERERNSRKSRKRDRSCDQGRRKSLRAKSRAFYVEPSFKATEKLGLFARYNSWNTAANAPGREDVHQVNAGVNYWIVPAVVLKADVQATNLPGDEGDGFNLGMGLSF